MNFILLVSLNDDHIHLHLLRLDQEECDIDHLEQKLDKVIKMCSQAVDSGKEYIRNQSAFATSLWDLQKHFQDDKSSTNALAKLIHCLQEMNKFHTTLLDQANRTVLKNLTSFLKKDVKEVKDYKQIFTKVSENLDTAVYKNAQVNKNRPVDIVEAENLLSATKSCFNHAALDYVNYITMLQNRKRHEILSTLLSYIQACSTYFHQGSDLCEDFGSFFKTLDEEISVMRGQYNLLDKQMQNRHTCVNELLDDGEKHTSSSTISSSTSNICTGGNVDDLDQRASQSSSRPLNHMEGYLFKRTSNAFKTWNRRWFCMRDNQLFYRKRTGEELPTVMEEDLRLCTVRLQSEADRRFCFEVISPTKSHILQADSEAMLQAWFKALQKGIDSAIQYHSPYSNDMRGIQSQSPTNETCPANLGIPGFVGGKGVDQKKGAKRINWTQILKIPGNSQCCDCGNADPKWASINLGITLCIACSGVHRSLGVHYSKVRSLTLDVWEPEILRVMIELGNDVINRVYEANIAKVNRFDRATDNCEISIREAWIKAKYIDRKFVLPLDGNCGLGSAPTPTSTSSSTLSFKSLDNDNSKYPEKWSIKKLRRRSYRKLLRKKKIEQEEGEEAAGALNYIDPDADEKDVNLNIPKKFNDILLIGENIIENNHNLTDENLLLLNSDQESTSGEEDNTIMECEEFDKLNPNFLLYKASGGHNLPVMCQALALGADKNWCNPDELDRTALHAAILSGSVMSCEFLILNGSNINAADRNGFTALHLATENSCTAQAYLLLKHKAKYDILAKNGKLPIDIAVEKTDADIVTLLRLAQLNDEIGPGEDGDNYSGGDSTYAAVMNDFSHFTSIQPQRLQRNRNAGATQAVETTTADCSLSSLASSSTGSTTTGIAPAAVETVVPDLEEKKK
ncbi:arf-GAP with coiled-coil, ANK repeat and PH domain-containing protein 2 isoform X2 [Sabethes cyaneus]|uniref:arf-GAP with coiled-coil, ANK repeat and PH domain-containing protein 2 isoform X2 n=1 Tax=Sabethes cyaneus TaxID=53552 RepID=UPI00237ED4A9|nr:arf-GAP with coiled-coil, ANK repeat and PH domain-containing protein 2 isoform X2 [Sabethes cyaneus]